MVYKSLQSLYLSNCAPIYIKKKQLYCLIQINFATSKTDDELVFIFHIRL